MILVLVAAMTVLPAYGAEARTVERYGGSTITEPNVKYVYDLLCDELTRDVPAKEVKLDESKHVTIDDVRVAYSLFISDYPECFWANADYSYSHRENNILSISPKYSFEGAALTTARAALEEAVTDIMSGMPNTNNYDKALYLHDRLVENVTYEFIGHHQTAYGALVDGKAVCAGYAAAYQLLLQRAGITAWTVTGYSNEPGEEPVAHAWNVLWPEDGVCVYTDATWNDSDRDTYHYYFNISKDEMEKDHTTSEMFKLPSCNHTDKSYFDNYGNTVDDSTGISELAAMFGAVEDGQRRATVYYEGNNIDSFTQWLKDNQRKLYEALGCGYGSCSYQLSSVANELHMTVTGNFTKETYKVTVNWDDTIRSYDAAVQYVRIGESMTDVTLHAAAGYYFPESYAQQSAYGVTIRRINASEIKISGTPDTDITLTVPSATKMLKAQPTNAVFTSTGVGQGILSSVEAGMKYSLDGINWTEIVSNENIELKNISSDKIYVIRSGDGVTTVDSELQTLTVEKPIEPSYKTDDDATVGDGEKVSEKGDGENDEKPSVNEPASVFGGCGITVTGAAAIWSAAMISLGVMLKKREE